MHDSPRIRRLRNDLTALERLRAQSSVFDFRASGEPPHLYRITLKGKSLWREHNKIKFLQTHHIEIKLGTSYPRSVPEIRWLTPIYHPNISEIGMVCLGGYGTHWVPSVQLDELCTMLWDMARYHNYDIRSPYNRDAALWAGHQSTILFPTDARPIRDLREAQGRIDQAGPSASVEEKADGGSRTKAGWRIRGASSVESYSLSSVEKMRRFIAEYGRSAPAPEPEITGRFEASSSSASSLPTDEPAMSEGVLILETKLESGGEGGSTEPPRGGEDILFID